MALTGQRRRFRPDRAFPRLTYWGIVPARVNDVPADGHRLPAKSTAYRSSTHYVSGADCNPCLQAVPLKNGGGSVRVRLIQGVPRPSKNAVEIAEINAYSVFTSPKQSGYIRVGFVRGIVRWRVRMRAVNKLTAVEVKTLSKPGLYADGLGLYLQVAAGGSKSWIFRFMRDGQARKMPRFHAHDHSGHGT